VTGVQTCALPIWARDALAASGPVLFVCLGNICRSPFAEICARANWPDRVKVASSGTFPVPGRASPAVACEVAREMGLSLDGHRSSVLTGRMVDEVVEKFGKLDILVCNAGINWDGVIWKMTEKQWDTVINVNLKGYFNYNRAAAAHFKDRKYGKIVNVSSINGLRGKFGQANYAASKGGEIAMSKTLAKELGKFNVNVNVVAPGMVMTEMAQSIPPEFLNKAVSRKKTRNRKRAFAA